MIFDSHAHYDDKQFDEDREAVFAQLKEVGVERVVNISNGWDDMLIFSVLPLLFATGEPLNQVNTGLIVLILAASVLHLILWEARLILFPERFFPWTNARLRCKSCKKRPCVGTVKGKFHD